MKWLPARPTVYRGIQMRSRLEADFARWLDDPDNEVFYRGRDSATWEYEPTCFASPDGQYLPDFRIPDPDGVEHAYIEIKPPAALQDAGGEWFHDSIEGVLQSLELIWESEPAATLYLIAWEYEARRPRLMFYSCGTIDRLWHVVVPGFPVQGVLLWGGRRQWLDLCELRNAPVARGRR